jgi:glycosyltransferase involved in cell wall biosynthesis
MNKSPIDITVCIPTYNGKKRLPEVLEALRSQIKTETIAWEIIVVDNNSTDLTAKVVQDYQADWPKTCSLRYVFEETQGAAFARLRGVKEALGELIGFLDDDNVPESNWVAAAYAFGQEHPQAGAYGSRIKGEFEGKTPPRFWRIAPFFALTQRGDKPLQYLPHQRILPPSAGLVVRKQAWLASVPEKVMLSGGRTGDLLPGEDIESMAYIQQAGWEVWYSPSLKVTHKIPSSRLERDYLISFFQRIGWSRYITRIVRYQPWQRPIIILLYMLSDLRKLIQHWFKYRQSLETDIVAACELELFVSSFLSPLYFFKKRLKLNS